MTLLKKEIKYTFKNLFIWVLVIILFNLMFASITDFITKQNSPFTTFLEKMPDTFLKAFNMDISIMSRPEGLFGSEGMTFMYIFFGIFGSLLASKLYASEFDNKTIEYLLTKPFSRKRIFFHKLFAIVFDLLILFGIFLFSELLFFKLFVSGQYSNKILFAFSLYLFVTEVFFAFLGILISLYIKSRKLTNSLLLGILFFMYFASTVTEGVKNTEFLRKISIFHYMPIIETIKNSKVYYINSIVILLISLIFIVFSLYVFQKQDIKI